MIIRIFVNLKIIKYHLWDDAKAAPKGKYLSLKYFNIRKVNMNDLQFHIKKTGGEHNYTQIEDRKS